MAELHVTYYERDIESGELEERETEDFEAGTGADAGLQALRAAEAWVEPDQRNRSYRIERLLPPD